MSKETVNDIPYTEIKKNSQYTVMMKFRINDACIPSVVINNINGVTSTNVHRECVPFVHNSRNKRTLMGN